MQHLTYPFDPDDWATITPLFAALIDAPVTEGDFMTWLDAWNSLDIDVNDAWTTLKRRSYSDTTDTEAERAYLIYTREMFSTYLGVSNTLAARALELQPQPPSPEYEQLWRRWQNQTTLFHPDSLGLQAEISELESGYRELMRHIEQLTGDANGHWLERRSELNALMLRMLKVRRELAKVSGMSNFLEFRWRELNRLDFSIEDCRQFHHMVEELIIPALVKLHAQATPVSDYPEIADPTTHADVVEQILEKLDPTYGAIFHTMRDGFLDLGRRPGKAVTSEQWFFPRAGMPYVHSASTQVGTTMHESGHAIHAYLSFQAQPSNLWLWRSMCSVGLIMKKLKAALIPLHKTRPCAGKTFCMNILALSPGG
jgi:oligoendopeptidase F